MTSIIIATHNNLELTKQCLETLFKTTGGKYEVIIIDNASTDGTQEYVAQVTKDQPNVRAIFNKTNIGFVKANNQGILLAQGDYICLCNNDLIFTHYWLRKLKRCLENNPKAGMVGPYSNFVSGRQQVQVNAKNAKEANDFVANFKMNEQVVNRLVFFCVLIRAELFRKDKCGLLDDEFSPGNFEDDYMCWLAERMGYELKIANAFVWHVGSASFKKDPAGYVKLLGRNQKIFYRKTAREIKISLCMVVGDYEDPEHLRRCLDSIAPYVDEVCINFTYRHFPRKTIRWDYGNWVFPDKYKFLFDGCPAVGGSKYSLPMGRISYEKWRWDFSYHRNQSKALATGQWIIWLDTQDTFESSTMLRYTIVQNDSIGDALFCNVFAPAEDGVETHLRHARIIRNKEEYYWQKPVHEDIVLSLKAANFRKVSTDLVVVHHGYKAVGSTFAKNLRNYKIMKKHIAKNPNADSLDLFHLANTYILLASQYRKRKWADRAMETLDRIIDLPLKEDDPLWGKVIFYKARLYHDAGKLAEAKKWYQHSINKIKYIESYLGMGEALVAERNYEAALGYLEAMFKTGMDAGFEVTSVPKNLREMEQAMFYNLGLCYFNREEYQKAGGMFQKSLSIKPRDIIAVDFLCDCLRRAGKELSAFQVTMKAINMMPNYVNGWANLGASEMLSKRYATAVIFLREALRQDPNHKVANQNLAKIEKETKQ